MDEEAKEDDRDDEELEANEPLAICAQDKMFAVADGVEVNFEVTESALELNILTKPNNVISLEYMLLH
jgi:hypothetical protein